jgi:NADH-quinone oxidoreductase subunit E
VSYLRLFSPAKVEVPRPANINRDALVYLASGIPKPCQINREQIHYLRAEPSILEKNVCSPVTPGAMNFPPFEISTELEKKADQRIAQYPADQARSAVLPLLHEVQHRFGFISPESIEWVAAKLDIAPIKVVEVVTFYPGFRQKAPGKLHFRVCRTLSCAMGGSYELMAKLCEITRIDRSGADGHSDPISVSPCGNFSVEYAECLASCGTAPVCLVNDDFHEGVTADKVQDLIAQYKGS